MKKALIIILSIVLILVIIGAVVYVALGPLSQNDGVDEVSEETAAPTTHKDDANKTIGDKHFKIGIVQTGVGTANKDCYTGFMTELDERKLTDNLEIVHVVDDNKDMCRDKIQGLIDADCDLLYTIGNFASETAAELTSDIPIVFGAVTSPDEVGLVESNEVPGGNVTGVSSYTPCFEQIDLIKTLIPDAKSIAVLYGGTDEDAVLQGIIAAREAENINLSCEQYPIEDKASLDATLKKIKTAKTDVIYIPIDKFLSSNMAAIISFSYENKIPVICGDEAGLVQGALATSVINYESIGRKAAGMAYDILFEGKDVSTISVMYKHDCTNIVNKTARDKLELEIPATALGEIDLIEPPTETATTAPATEAAAAAGETTGETKSE